MRIMRFWLIFVLMGALAVQSCRKGCTNEKAINFDSGAQTDDGNCFYCDSARALQNWTQTNARDNNSQSPHFDEFVIRMFVRANVTRYTGNYCKTLGLENDGSGLCRSTYHDIVLFNETSDTMVYTGNINIHYSSQGITIPFTHLSIAPMDSFKMNNVWTACPTQIFGLSIDESGSSFMYK